jgi:hypothetical protein
MGCLAFFMGCFFCWVLAPQYKSRSYNMNNVKSYLRHAIRKTAVAALSISAAFLLVSSPQAQTLNSNATGTNNGFYYTFWKDNGDASMTLLAGGRYTSQWTNSNNWVGGKGWNPGNNSRTVSYSGVTAHSTTSYPL